jgi:hypothetical protein
MGKRRSIYRVSLRKPEGKRALERPRLRWKDLAENLLASQGLCSTE